MEPVFIVAQYKCGTSWLLGALSAHPAVIGLREIDIVRGAYAVSGASAIPADRDHRLSHFFGMSAWCNRNQFDRDPVESLAAGEHAVPQKINLDRPQGFADLQPDTALDLYRRVRDAGQPQDALDAFVAATAAAATSEMSHLVLKAADQVAVFDLLSAWQPGARKIAITRDGRDAAISAAHYKQLMQDAPWFSGDADYWRLLDNWASRAEMIVDLASRGELEVVRYEDLSADFAGTLGPVLEWLGLDASPEVIEAINARSSFEARTGRKRGSDGTGVIRKGAVGEWLEVLSPEDKRAAWDRVGSQLAALGYVSDAPAAPLPSNLTRL
jgi:hypothetical protein